MGVASGVGEQSPARQSSGMDMYANTTNLQRVADIGLQLPVAPAATEKGLLIAVVNRDRPDLVLPLLNVFAEVAEQLNATGQAFQVQIADTGTTDPEVLQAYEDLPEWCQVTRNLVYQFSANNNAVVGSAPTLSRVLLLNNDVILPGPEPILAMMERLDTSDELGVVGLRLDFPDGTVQHNGIDFLHDGPELHQPYHPAGGTKQAHRPGRSMRVPAVTGACLMTRSDLWARLGGLDEGYAHECQDVDYCLAVGRLGYQVEVLDAGVVVHLEGATRDGAPVDPGDRRRLLRRWRSYLRAELP